MSNIQILTIALASVPTLIAVLIGILINNSRLGDTNTRISELRSQMDSRISDLSMRITELRSHMDDRFSHMDTRFDESRDTWRAELHRVEEVIDARLKHLEER